MAVDEIVHVAIAPPHTLEVNLVKHVATVINRDLYGTRLLLSGKIPRIVSHCNSVQTAKLIADSLRLLGLVAFVCKDTELRKTYQSFRAHTVKFGQKEAVFSDRVSNLMTIEPENTFLILKGRMQTQTETQVTSIRTKLNLPATLLTGGIPIWRGVKEKNRETSVETEYFVRFYNRSASEPVVEIFQYDFDYAFLGAKTAPSSLSNFDTLVLKIRDVFPQAVFDEKLTDLFGADMSSTTPSVNIEINCKLMYLYYQAISGHQSVA